VAKRRLSVRKIKEVLRLHYEKGFSTRQIAKSLGDNVQDIVHRNNGHDIVQ
jgi:DNA-directed RNA polymerase specialized sigma24 family protein